MQKEAQEYVKKCNQCQQLASNIHQPGGILNPLSSLWPFAQWGLDIVGPFPKAVGNKKYILVGTISQHGISPWEVYVDGASNQKGSRVGLVLISLEKVIVEKSLRLSFLTTNNEAEYEALMMEMVMVQKMGGKSIKFFSDLRLVVGQVKGQFKVKDERM